MKSKLLSENVFDRLTSIVFLFTLLFLTTVTHAQTITANTQSTNNGFFYSFWNDGSKGSASMTLGAAGNYSTTWSNIGNFTAGKGWAVGKADRVVCYSGSFNGGSNGFLALYGWTKNNLIEYYVCENHGSWTPPGNTSDIQQKGTYTSDGGTYTIYTATRTNQPSIIGNATFKQYWSVRTQTRSSGTITFANHVAAWQAAGMPMGTTWDYQIMESEGYNSSGSSNITVSECPTNSCTTPAPTTTASFDYEVGATATQLTATGTAIKWYTVETAGTALSSAPTPSTATAGTIKYYVGQTLNGCEGPRVEVTIRVSQKYKIFKVSTPITIDGTIEASWTNASVLPAAAAKLLSGTISNSADLSGNFKALWDDTYLYVLADVTDANLINESTNVYDDDAVEVYVDINNNKATTYGTNDVQYSFGWNDGTTVGVLPAGRSTTNVTYKAVVKTGGYIIEARIPWTTLQGTPVIGQLVGMDFMINDDDDNGARDSKLAWNADADDAWEDPSLFGTAILQGLLPCTTPAAPTVTTPVVYCQNATATPLTATGTSLLWYTNATTGTGTATLTPVTTTTGNIMYYVTQNAGGCESARAQITVTVNAAPTATITAGGSTTLCAGGSVTLTASTGSSYIWKNGTTQVGTAATYAATAAGSYTVEVTSASTCKATSAATVITVTTAPAAPTVVTPVTYCQGATAVPLTANGSVLKWYADNTTTTSLPSAPIPSTTAAGTTTYFVSQSPNVCESGRAQITVIVNALPTATITAGGSTTFCAGGSVTLTASTGSSYIWKNGTTQVGTTATYTATAAGSYTVEVTNASTCKATSAATVVTINTAGTAPTVVTPVTYCQGATAVPLTANGSVLKWYADNTTTTAFPSAPTPSTAAAGTTTYFVSQAPNVCESARAQITVIVNALPTATITAASSTTLCAGGSVTLTASTGSSYIWKNGTTQVGTAATYAATAAGSYTVEVTNASTCKATSAATVVTVATAPAAPTVVTPVTYCQGATAVPLTANGSVLKWYADNTTTTALPSAPTPSTAAVGTTTYFVSQSPNVCESARAQITVTVNALPAATITANGATTFCNGGSVTLTASTGSSYIWKNGTTQVGTAATYAATAAGSYTVEVTNASTCKATSAATVVTINTAGTAPTVVTPVTYCQGATAVPLTANGSVLKWYADNTTTTALPSAPTPSTAVAGTTTYFVSQAPNVCESARAQITVVVNALPAATITAAGSTTLCAGGSVTLTASTGSSYIWKNGTTQVGTAATYAATAAGSYTVEVTNTSTCKATSAATVITIGTTPTAPTVVTPVTYCQGATAVPLTANGSVLKWYADNTTATALSSAPTPSTAAVGTTTYFVSQAPNVCESARAQITVTVNALPTAVITPASTTAIQVGGSVTLNANTGSGLQYKWFNGSTQVGTGASYVANVVGSYVVEVTNASDCKVTSLAVDVTSASNRPSLITITSPAANTTITGQITIAATVSDPDGTITLVEYLDGNTVIGTNASQPYSFDWTDAVAGNHVITIRVTDSNGGITTSAPVTVTAATTTTGITTGNNAYANVYPIPARDEIVVETDLDLTNASVKITNALGEEVLLSVSIQGSDAKLNVSNLTDGAYILMIRQDSNIVTKKIIIAH